MNKTELIDSIAAESGLTKADARKALDAFVVCTINALKEGDPLSLVGFGSFSIVDREAHKGRNPNTGAEIMIAAKKVVKFKVGADMQKAVE